MCYVITCVLLQNVLFHDKMYCNFIKFAGFFNCAKILEIEKIWSGSHFVLSCPIFYMSQIFLGLNLPFLDVHTNSLIFLIVQPDQNQCC